MKYASSPFLLLAFSFSRTAFALPANARYATQLGQPSDISLRETLPAIEPRAVCRLPTKPPFGKRDVVDTHFFRRQGVGSTITVAGKQYKLIEEVSGQGGETTFRAETVPGSTTVYAKRPNKAGDPSQAFQAEITNTQKAAQVLNNNMFISSGKDQNNYMWLITAAAPGGEIFFRWDRDKTRFAKRTVCETDMADARKVIAAQQQKLADGARFIHGDNHPGNWYLDLTGSIKNAVPIDFGVVRPPPPTSNIEQLLRDQYKYSNDMWGLFVECGYCKP